MSYEEIKQYLERKYQERSPQDIRILINSIESLYLSKKMPYVESPEFDIKNRIATDWVVRATIQILEKGDTDITSYSENGLEMKLGEGMLCEIVPNAGVVKTGDR